MIIFSYAMVTVFEAIISYIFISGKFAQKMSNMGLFLCFSLSAALQFIINTVGVEYSNIVAFLACNLLLCIFCFNTNVFQAIFTSILKRIVEKSKSVLKNKKVRNKNFEPINNIDFTPDFIVTPNIA